MLSDKVIRELLNAIRGHVANLFRACEGIALLDMLAAFGQSTTSRDYIRPEFGDTLALKAARHPIIEMVRRFRPCTEMLKAMLTRHDTRCWRGSSFPMMFMLVRTIGSRLLLDAT